ncbi:MAG TPA: tRNA pseudouridine(38-40) synthase TruA [Candidatus Didemnitutus sp.]|jgi:tRNA pseudouridine38-40 synthase
MTGTVPASTRWKVVCAYDGTPFHGWQSQPTGNAIQDVIERQLAKVVHQPLRVHGSGRTDSGVHALGQVFHFDAPWSHGADKLRLALQAGLPRSIQLKSLRRAPATFHARFSARGKIYRYQIVCGDADPFTAPFSWSVRAPLDWDRMQAAAELLRGTHDFWAFSAENGTRRESTIRTLKRLVLHRSGRRIRLTLEADGFLFKMARGLTGALVAVGSGKLDSCDIAELLRTGRRIPEVQTAPPEGLFLVRVIY